MMIGGDAAAVRRPISKDLSWFTLATGSFSSRCLRPAVRSVPVGRKAAGGAPGEEKRLGDGRGSGYRGATGPPGWVRPGGVDPGKMQALTGADASETSAQGVLAVHHLRKSYKERRVVEDISTMVRRGEVIGLLGPNGAGKTTLFYMITGLIRPDGGQIELDGHDVTRLPMYRRARLGIGYLPQEASIFRGLNVEDNIRAVLEIIEPSKRKRASELEALLEEFDIKSLRKTPSVALSGGERRRCEIARALAGRPSFMLLDEPFAGIDPIAVGDIQLLVQHLKQRGIGVLITDHNVRETLGLIDRAYIVHAGRVLVEGTPAEIVKDPKVRRFYLGEGFRL
jgi:lipopolysaccharide export system ATP-binding protein